MKFRILAIVLACTPFLGIAQKLSISAHIIGLPDKTEILLTDLDDPSIPLAKAKSSNGTFLLSSKLLSPGLVGLAVGNNHRTALFVGNDKVKISGNFADPIDSWKIEGSAIQSDFELFQNTFIPKFEQLNALAQQMQMNSNDSVRFSLEQKVSDLEFSIDEFVKGHPSSPVSVLAILSTIGLSSDMSLVENKVKKLAPALLESKLGQQLTEAIAESKFNAIGSVAPNFSQIDTNGVAISLDTYRGKYVLVDFWASWCGPCRQENPNVVKTYNKFKDKNFTVLGVSLDEDRRKWLYAIAKDELKWAHVSDLKGWNNAVAQQYRITAIPRNFLIGPDGKILAKDLRGADLENKLCEILGCN